MVHKLNSENLVTIANNSLDVDPIPTARRSPLAIRTTPIPPTPADIEATLTTYGRSVVDSLERGSLALQNHGRVLEDKATIVSDMAVVKEWGRQCQWQVRWVVVYPETHPLMTGPNGRDTWAWKGPNVPRAFPAILVNDWLDITAAVRSLCPMGRTVSKVVLGTTVCAQQPNTRTCCREWIPLTTPDDFDHWKLAARLELRLRMLHGDPTYGLIILERDKEEGMGTVQALPYMGMASSWKWTQADETAYEDKQYKEGGKRRLS